ncbi:anti-anti-sigma factor [Amycolatopsis mediterranei S699]|uniref:Anti-anti-sigma factor n=2 Tax=Amycolatopsis mediterranei TaxID=33910 RepID=A0A0H3DAF7_AMYMU|nr:STAS domain-containing protein [Amycolatopsis mediterranei]ADJ47636.1 anti-anti-sigma factor [Amycolatopsis mediterranei U32]AEK44520.1 anti-anti-sigma factor [Amycolatopsis mediterranei S699]AFO79347.1 anti-anti-sigma factor [Amycolatopsis mediterranei S699]AGT86475.1 anti-anti-sigma factor [Amycolatopsis mediterranei RB]KDO11925.1 anti-anti-sigma factor [Amycolatopsis mediterranei]
MTTALTLAGGQGDDGDRVLSVAGEIDMSNAAEFGAALDGELAAGAAVTVDLTGVSYLDSAGVAVLFDRVGEHDLRLVAPPLLDRVLRVSGLTQVAKVMIR